MPRYQRLSDEKVAFGGDEHTTRSTTNGSARREHSFDIDDADLDLDSVDPATHSVDNRDTISLETLTASPAGVSSSSFPKFEHSSDVAKISAGGVGGGGIKGLWDSLNPQSMVRDAVLGLADGLTVPFALAAGVSLLGSAHIVLAAGAAELASGSISMGLGGYLASKAELEHYQAEHRKLSERVRRQLPTSSSSAANASHTALTISNFEADPDMEALEQAFGELGITNISSQLHHMRQRNPDQYVELILRLVKEMDEPGPYDAIVSGVIISIGYLVGGILPLLPYAIVDGAQKALFWSCGTTFLALVIFGVAKAILLPQTGASTLISVVRTVLVGAVAAIASFLVVRLTASPEAAATAAVTPTPLPGH
ncbi:DUF125-domain-containing protein [Ramicandelaber brevisporus]|nr:DUF125-domain-containing protein [Ramicandelaber brevisporus]